MSTDKHRFKLARRLASFLVLFAAGALAQGSLEREVAFDIPPQPLTQALLQFGQQANVQIMLAAHSADGQRSGALKGTLRVDAALAILLRGSGLVFDTEGNTVTVAPPGDIKREVSALPPPPVNLARADAGTEAPQQKSSPVVESAGTQDGNKLDEIVVTAQKRTERLQEVPVPVTAVAAPVLVENNQLRLQDYYSRIPGLSLIASDANSVGAPMLAIRGVTSGPGLNPTVGIVVDDVPYGSSTSWGGGFLAPDLDPSDLERIEVLRGPQGALYGASSIGGLLKYVTVDPSTEGVQGRLQAGLSSIRNASDPGYSFRASVNVPLSETLAVRASGYTRFDGGYIDDPVLGREGVNEERANGGRISALWRPSDRFSLKLNALAQESDREGSPNVMPALGELQQSFLRDTGSLDRKEQAYSATITARLGSAELIAVSGYNLSRGRLAIDYTPAYGPFTENGFPGTGFDGFGVAGTPDIVHTRVEKLTQEVRLSVPLTERVEWLIGGFYTDEKATNAGNIYAVDPATGARAGTWWDFDMRNRYSDFAAFSNLTFGITDRFDLQVGGRYSEIEQKQGQDYAGPFNTYFLGLPDPFVFAQLRSSASAFTYLVTPRLKISPQLMVYARFASGYRPGGNNSSAAGTVPPTFRPDRTSNYEVGMKGSALGGTLSFDASVYYIDWNDIQVLLLDPAFNGYYDNASAAESKGAEFAIELMPVSDLTVSAWVAWNDAELTQGLPASSTGRAAPGDRLPFSSRFSGGLSLDKNIPFGNGVTGFVGATLSYVGDREGTFASAFVLPPQRQSFPSFLQSDLRLGARVGTWTVNLSVNNVADKRGILGGGIGTLYADAFNYIRPRTIGLSVSKTY